MGEGCILKEVKPVLLRTWGVKGVKGKLKLGFRDKLPTAMRLGLNRLHTVLITRGISRCAIFDQTYILSILPEVGDRFNNLTHHF